MLPRLVAKSRGSTAQSKRNESTAPQMQQFFVSDSSASGEREQSESSYFSTNPRDSVANVYLRQRAAAVERQWVERRQQQQAWRQSVQHNVYNNIPERRSAAFIAGEALGKQLTVGFFNSTRPALFTSHNVSAWLRP